MLKSNSNLCIHFCVNTSTTKLLICHRKFKIDLMFRMVFFRMIKADWCTQCTRNESGEGIDVYIAICKFLLKQSYNKSFVSSVLFLNTGNSKFAKLSVQCTKKKAEFAC